MTRQETLGTIWEVPDELWELIEPIILEEDSLKARGRKRACARQTPNGTIHRTFQRWVESGVLRRMWGVLVAGCEELGGVDWEWQPADGAMGKARWGGPDWTQPDGQWQGRRQMV